MIHQDTSLKFISEEIGFGVVATKPIPKGTITWVHDRFDHRMTSSQFKKLEPLYRKTMRVYCYREPNGDFTYCWDNARFVNHSFNSNCLTTAYDFEIAVRDIEVGEELTNDYGYLNIDAPFTPVPEVGSERKVVYPDDLLRFHKIWDAQLLDGLKNTPSLEQPLRPLIRADLWTLIVEIAKGEKEMDSILACYFQRNTSIAA